MSRPQAARFTLARHAGTSIAVLMFAFFFVLSVPQSAESQTFKVIHNFTAKGNDGATPYGGPILDQQGNLYGTTYLGGRFGAGSVYKLAPSGSSWKYTSLYSFTAGADGSGPAFGSLAVNPMGAMFGTTEGGGFFGTAFAVCAKASCSWRENVVHSFGTGTDGAQPIGGVAFDAAGNFYGTTSLGGANGNGTVYEVAPSGKEKIIYSFGTGTDAINPAAGVTLDADGNLYGTASLGGAFGFGAVYKLARTGSGWAEKILYNFRGLDDGQNPVGGVILDKNGDIYGGTFAGGVNGGGVVYELSPSSGGRALKVLHSFSGSFGGPYNQLTFDTTGNIYGITNADGANGLGSVFKLTRGNDDWTYTDLYDFVGGDDGASPYGSLAVDAKGNIFGTAAVGGSDNQGIVFGITP